MPSHSPHITHTQPHWTHTSAPATATITTHATMQYSTQCYHAVLHPVLPCSAPPRATMQRSTPCCTYLLISRRWSLFWKYWVKALALLTHWRAEFIKQEFPRLLRPVAPGWTWILFCGFFFCLSVSPLSRTSFTRAIISSGQELSLLRAAALHTT